MPHQAEILYHQTSVSPGSGGPRHSRQTPQSREEWPSFLAQEKPSHEVNYHLKILSFRTLNRAIVAVLASLRVPGRKAPLVAATSPTAVKKSWVMPALESIPISGILPPMTKHTSITLGAHFLGFIEAQVASGRFA